MTVRQLSAAPRVFLDPTTREPAFGAYEGPLPAIDATPSLLDRFARRKRWVYVALVTETTWVSIVVVRTGYAATTFAFVYDLSEKRMLADESALGTTLLAKVTDDPHADGPLATFRLGKTQVSMTRRGSIIDLKARIGSITLDAQLDEAEAPPPIAAIGRIEGGVWDATEKRTLTRVHGTLTCNGKTHDLATATGGYDYTHGLLPRHTQWRWGFALGKVDGQPFAFNVVQGFLGEVECAAFFGGKVFPIAEPRFVFDRNEPLGAWRLEAEGIDLTFTPGAMHADATNLVLIKSRFVQPVGTFRGTMRMDGRDLTLVDVPGVVEDQDVLW